MQGFISSVGNIDSGGQGESLSSIIRVKCAMGGISPTSSTTINGKTYYTFPVSSSYVKFYSVSPLNDEDELTLSDAQMVIAYPISNNNSDCGCNLIINNGALSGSVLSTENTLYNIEFVFVYVENVGEQTVSYFQNYTDMILSSGGEGTGSFAIPAQIVTPTLQKSLAYVSINKDNLVRINDNKYTYTDEDRSVFTLTSTAVDLHELITRTDTKMYIGSTITLTNVYQYPVTYFTFRVANSSSAATLPTFRVELYLNNSVIISYEKTSEIPVGGGYVIITGEGQVPYNTFYDKIVLTYLSGPTNFVFGLNYIGIAAKKTVNRLDGATYEDNTFYHLVATENSTVYSINDKPAMFNLDASVNKLYYLKKQVSNYLSLLPYS